MHFIYPFLCWMLVTQVQSGVVLSGFSNIVGRVRCDLHLIGNAITPGIKKCQSELQSNSLPRTDTQEGIRKQTDYILSTQSTASHIEVTGVTDVNQGNYFYIGFEIYLILVVHSRTDRFSF